LATINDIEARALGPDVERFRYTAHQPEVFTTTTIVRIRDQDGFEGIGAYDSDSFGDWDLAPLETLRPLLPSLIGIDALDHAGLIALLTEGSTSPFPPGVRSAIDIASWDLTARRDGDPVVRSLGGGEPAGSLPSYASIPLLADERTYLHAIEGYVRDGFGAVKIHAWGEPERDASLLHRVRGEFDSLVVMHDAEGRYDRDGAEAIARTCADIGARWFEAPLPDFDLEGYRRLRAGVPDVDIIPAGDAIWDPRLMEEVLRDPPWDALRFDVSFVGGFTAARALMAVAAEAGLPVELTSYGHSVIQAANLHAALAFGRTSFFEQAVPPEPFEHAVQVPLRTERDGHMRISEGPGLGIQLDPAAVERATLGVARAGERGWSR
jgi:L-alanine-DL-glutamate epimerase-like enolase superfamily enzyme